MLPAPPAVEKRSLPVPVSAIAVDSDSFPLATRAETGWRILIAEDMAVNQMVARGLLEARGHAVDVAADGLEAIAKAEANDYDLIFMDMQMPRMDGLEATRMIRARGGKLASVPIVAMTANAFGSDQAACIEAGMTDFLAKPIDAETLRETLDRVMSGRVAPVQQLSDVGVAFNPTPLDALRRQLGAGAVEDILDCCRLEVPPLLKRLESCLAENAVDKLGDLLGALGSALANLGVVAAADYCRTQSERLAAGKPTDAQLVEVLDRLIEEGWGMCDAFVTSAKATEPLASAA
jgi:CheY-like chemotaxis protein